MTKPPPTAYCFSQTPQETYLIRLIRIAMITKRVHFINFPKCTLMFSNVTCHQLLSVIFSQPVADKCQCLVNCLVSDTFSVALKVKFPHSCLSCTVTSHKYGSHRCFLCSTARTCKSCHRETDIGFGCFRTAFCHLSGTFG